MVLENSEIEKVHFRSVCIIESRPGQKLQWSSVSILNFLSSFLVMIILSNILNRNCLSLLPTSQPSEDARLARRQRIVPREECCMQKNSRLTFESAGTAERVGLGGL